MKKQNEWVVAAGHLIILAVAMMIVYTISFLIVSEIFGPSGVYLITPTDVVVAILVLVALYFATPYSAKFLQKKFEVGNWKKVTTATGSIALVLTIISLLSNLGIRAGGINIINIATALASLWIIYTRTQAVYGGKSVEQVMGGVSDRVEEIQENMKGEEDAPENASVDEEASEKAAESEEPKEEVATEKSAEEAAPAEKSGEQEEKTQ